VLLKFPRVRGILETKVFIGKDEPKMEFPEGLGRGGGTHQ